MYILNKNTDLYIYSKKISYPGMSKGNPRDFQGPPIPALSECHDTVWYQIGNHLLNVELVITMSREKSIKRFLQPIQVSESVCKRKIYGYLY